MWPFAKSITGMWIESRIIKWNAPNYDCVLLANRKYHVADFVRRILRTCSLSEYGIICSLTAIERNQTCRYASETFFIHVLCASTASAAVQSHFQRTCSDESLFSFALSRFTQNANAIACTELFMRCLASRFCSISCVHSWLNNQAFLHNVLELSIRSCTCNR